MIAMSASAPGAITPFLSSPSAFAGFAVTPSKASSNVHPVHSTKFFNAISWVSVLPASRAFGIPAYAIDDFNGVGAQNVSAIGHIGCANGIGYEQNPRLSFRASEKAHHARMNMDAVRDDFGKYSIIRKNLSHNARIAMRKLPHGIKGVHRVTDSLRAARCELVPALRWNAPWRR